MVPGFWAVVKLVVAAVVDGMLVLLIKLMLPMTSDMSLTNGAADSSVEIGVDEMLLLLNKLLLMMGRNLSLAYIVLINSIIACSYCHPTTPVLRMKCRCC